MRLHTVQVLHAALLFSIPVAAFAQSPPSPATIGPWSAPVVTTHEYTAFETHEWYDAKVPVKYKEKRSTRTRNITVCSTIGGEYCGGSNVIAVGIGFEISWGLVTMNGEISQTWTAPSAEPCHRCGVFACRDIVEQEVTRSGECRVGLLGSWEKFGPETSKSVEKIGNYFLVQRCNDTPAAQKLCCGDKPPGNSPNAIPSTWTIPPGFAEAFFTRKGLSRSSLGSRVDLTKLDEWVSIQLPLIDDDESGNPTGLPSYAAQSIDELSLRERIEIQAAVLAHIDPQNIGQVPFENTLLTIINADGSFTNIDLGVADEMFTNDYFVIKRSADVDLDGFVTSLDFDLVVGEMGSPVWHGRGDLNLDGITDYADLEIVIGSMN